MQNNNLEVAAIGTTALVILGHLLSALMQPAPLLQNLASVSAITVAITIMYYKIKNKGKG